jgi:hypothetical protein
MFSGHRIVCYDAATVEDVQQAQVVVAAFANAREKRVGWEFHKSLLHRLGLGSSSVMGKVLVHIDDEYGARRRQSEEDWSVYCGLYAGWKHVFRNYWSEAWAKMVPFSTGRMNCTALCPGSSRMDTRVEWMPLGWSNNWQPMRRDVQTSSRRSHFIGFYGNEKYQLRPNRAALMARFERETGMKVNRILGKVGFGKGNLSHYFHLMQDTRMCLQISGLSAECYRMYESLDAGCVPVVIDQFGQETDAQYRFLLGGRRRPPFPRGIAPLDVRAVLARLQHDDSALDAMQAETHSWWNRSLGHIRNRLLHVSWSWCGVGSAHVARTMRGGLVRQHKR